MPPAPKNGITRRRLKAALAALRDAQPPAGAEPAPPRPARDREPRFPFLRKLTLLVVPTVAAAIATSLAGTMAKQLVDGTSATWGGGAAASTVTTETPEEVATTRGPAVQPEAPSPTSSRPHQDVAPERPAPPPTTGPAAAAQPRTGEVTIDDHALRLSLGFLRVRVDGKHGQITQAHQIVLLYRHAGEGAGDRRWNVWTTQQPSPGHWRAEISFIADPPCRNATVEVVAVGIHLPSVKAMPGKTRLATAWNLLGAGPEGDRPNQEFVFARTVSRFVTVPKEACEPEREPGQEPATLGPTSVPSSTGQPGTTVPGGRQPRLQPLAPGRPGPEAPGPEGVTAGTALTLSCCPAGGDQVPGDTRPVAVEGEGGPAAAVEDRALPGGPLPSLVSEAVGDGGGNL